MRIYPTVSADQLLKDLRTSTALQLLGTTYMLAAITLVTNPANPTI